MSCSLKCSFFFIIFEFVFIWVFVDLIIVYGARLLDVNPVHFLGNATVEFHLEISFLVIGT